MASSAAGTPPPGPGRARGGAARDGAEYRLTPRRRAREAEWGRVAQRAFNSATRGAALGLTGRGALGAFALLLKRRQRGQGVGGAARAELAYVARWAAFLGAYSGGYVALDELLKFAVGRERSRQWRGAVAGAAMGPTMLLTGSSPHTSLATYLLLRAFVLLVRIANKTRNGALRALLAPTRWEHGDVGLMCLSSSQLLYSWIMMPHTLPGSYRRFLDSHGAKPEWLLRSIESMLKQNSTPAPRRPLDLAGTLPAGCHPALRRAKTPYRLILQDQTLASHFVEFWLRGYLRALPVYLPVYVVPALLVHRKAFLDPKKELWKKTLKGMARSSAFLASYCSFAWSAAAGSAWVMSPVAGTRAFGGKWLAAVVPAAGLATFLEKKSRRLELALYCFARAIESFYLCAHDWGWVPRRGVPRFDIVMFSAATGILMHAYSDNAGRHRDVFRNKYLNVIDFMFGNTGHNKECIRHVPSNSELAGQAIHSLKKSLSATQLAALVEAMENRLEKEDWGLGGSAGGVLGDADLPGA